MSLTETGHTRITRRWIAGGIAVLALIAGTDARAQELRVLPEEAIPFTAFLKKAEFDQRFPGETADGPSKLDPGWYVSYEHESLHYCFGPILLESTGEDYKAQLERIVADAVAQRPSITGYKIALRYEPSTPPDASSSESSTERAAGAAPPPPPPKRFSFFDLIRRVFGF